MDRVKGDLAVSSLQTLIHFSSNFGSQNELFKLLLKQQQFKLAFIAFQEAS